MESFKKIIHEVQFGKYLQEWEISFVYDKEEVYEVKVTAHNYNAGKFSHSTNITAVIHTDLIDAMIQEIDIYEERINDAADRDMFGMLDDLDSISIRSTD